MEFNNELFIDCVSFNLNKYKTQNYLPERIINGVPLKFDQIYFDWRFRSAGAEEVELEASKIESRKINHEHHKVKLLKNLRLSDLIYELNNGLSRERCSMEFTFEEARLNQIFNSNEEYLKSLFLNLNSKKAFSFFVIPNGWKKVFNNIFLYRFCYTDRNDGGAPEFNFTPANFKLSVYPLIFADEAPGFVGDTFFFKVK